MVDKDLEANSWRSFGLNFTIFHLCLIGSWNYFYLRLVFLVKKSFNWEFREIVLLNIFNRSIQSIFGDNVIIIATIIQNNNTFDIDTDFY